MNLKNLGCTSLRQAFYAGIDDFFAAVKAVCTAHMNVRLKVKVPHGTSGYLISLISR